MTTDATAPLCPFTLCMAVLAGIGHAYQDDFVHRPG